MDIMKRKIVFKIGDLVKHRFIDFGLGIVLEKRKSNSFGDILDSYVIHFPLKDVKRLLYCSEICADVKT